MKAMSVVIRTAPAVLTGLLLLAGSAEADLNKERGNIVSTDWNKMEMKIKDPKGRVGTWQVVRDCEVKFSDQEDKFPNPKLRDLKAPMYVHFMFEAGTKLIQHIEVKDVGYDAGRGGPGIEQKGVVSNFDMNIGHLELVLDPGGRKTFEVDPKRELIGLKKGQTVTVLIENRDGREVVTKISR
jgi:hypothetical protein